MMNNPGSSASQNCSGPSSSSWANWDQNNGGVSVTALEPRVHYHHHHHNYNTNNSESTSTSTCSRLGWEWDHHNTMLLSHDRQGDGTTDPTKPPMATATLVNSEIRSYFLEGMLPYGNLAHSGHIGQLLSANPSMRSGCFPGMGSSNSGDIQFLGDVVKQETYGGLSRIGLSLGGAYFSAEEDLGFGGRLVKRARGSHGGGSSQVVPMCQAEGCRADLSCAKHYHRRHKVCEQHSKAALVVLGGQNQRFCQQCSRFHLLSEFDDGKRSCRKRLADHNRRRRKPQTTTNNNNNNNNVARIANDESTPLKEDLQDSASNNPPNGAQAKPVSCPASQASTPPISLSSPAPLMIQNKDDNNRRQMSVAPVCTHDPMYNRYLHAVNPQTGPKLSLSSSLAAIPMDNNHQWRQQHQKAEEDGKNYEPIKQSCVPWLRQHNINESRSPQNINLQPENSASSNGSCSHAFSPNLLPIQSSRSGLSTSRNWAMNNARDHSRDQGHSNTNFASRVSPVNLKGHHQVLSLLESSSTFKDYQKGMGRQQKATSSSETESSSTSGSGGDVKAFPDLHNLRPFASPSTYDSNINTALI